jgi:hypothetical protein
MIYPSCKRAGLPTLNKHPCSQPEGIALERSRFNSRREVLELLEQCRAIVREPDQCGIEWDLNDRSTVKTFATGVRSKETLMLTQFLGEEMS